MDQTTRTTPIPDAAGDPSPPAAAPSPQADPAQPATGSSPAAPSPQAAAAPVAASSPAAAVPAPPVGGAAPPTEAARPLPAAPPVLPPWEAVAPPEPARFRLRRSRTDRMVAGVCGGLAPSLGVDAALLRIGLVLLTVFGAGIGAVFYVAAWILAPEE